MIGIITYGLSLLANIVTGTKNAYTESKNFEEAKRNGDDYYMDANNHPHNIKNGRQVIFTHVKDHAVMMDINGKTIYHDYTQNCIDKEIEEERAAAIEKGENAYCRMLRIQEEIDLGLSQIYTGVRNRIYYFDVESNKIYSRHKIIPYKWKRKIVCDLLKDVFTQEYVKPFKKADETEEMYEIIKYENERMVKI